MPLANFWSVTTGYDVKYLLPVGIDKFEQRQENDCCRSDHYQAVVNQTVFNEH